MGELQWKVQLQQQFIEEQNTAMAELKQQVTQLQQQVSEQQWHRPHDASCRCRVCVLEQLQQEKSSSVRSCKDRKNLLCVLPSPLPAIQRDCESDSGGENKIADMQSDGVALAVMTIQQATTAAQAQMTMLSEVTTVTVLTA